MTDSGEMVFLPALMPWLRRHAPLLDVQVMQLPLARYLRVFYCRKFAAFFGQHWHNPPRLNASAARNQNALWPCFKNAPWFSSVCGRNYL